MDQQSEQNQSNSQPAAAPSANSATPAGQPMSDTQAKSSAVLAWIFAPFTSFVWKDEPNQFLRSHARESLYIGIAQLVLLVAFTIVQWIVNLIFFSTLNFSLFGLAALINLLFFLLWLGLMAFVIVPRILGILAANNGQEWRLPAVSDMVKKYVKL